MLSLKTPPISAAHRSWAAQTGDQLRRRHRSRGRIGRRATVVSIALLSAAILSGLPSAAHAAKPPRTVAYTALGDSIAFGIGATFWYGYVPRFRDFLRSAAGGASLTNRSFPGYSSGDLLQQLTSDGATRQAVKSATVATISIGGNNLLDCASDNYAVLDTTCGANGVAAFKRDWPQIQAQVRSSIRYRGALYVMTLYNPYRETEPNHSIADGYIRQINGAIGTASAAYEYEVAGVYEAFRGQTTSGAWKVCQLTHFCESSRDPHPSDSGHAEIARLHEPLYP